MKRMRKKQKELISDIQDIFKIMLIAMLTLIASAITVSATAIGDDYNVGGVGLGWILVGAVVVIALIAWGLQVTKKAIKPFVPVLAIVLIAGLCLQFVEVTPEAAAITEDVTWDVTCASSTDDITIDNDGRTITKLIWADVDLEVINGTDDGAWVATTDDPDLNFTISPSLAEGVSETTNQATTNCRVLTPDQTFTEDSTAYDLFEDASTGGDKNLVWTTDGTDDYESKLCTVTIGGSETARLVINLLDDGLSQREAGESHSFQISIGGITYTMTVIITALT